VRSALLALTLAGPVAAPPVDVEWHGDPTCPSDHPFKHDIATHLYGGEATTEVHARVDVAQIDDVWALTLTLTTADGASTRELTGASCAAVSAAAAFITALVVDPGLLTRERAPEPTIAEPPPIAAPTTAAPAPAPIVARPPARRSPPREPTPVRGFLRLAGGLEAFTLPRVGPSLNPAVGLQGERWRLELTGLYRAPTRAHAEDPRVSARLRLWSLGVRGCGLIRRGRLEIPLCLGVEAGQAIGDADGPLARAQRARLPWLAAVAGPALAWAPRPWLALWVGVDVAVRTIPGKFTVTGAGDVHTIGPVGLRAALGVEARFP
jgi:hypothetical protein